MLPNPRILSVVLVAVLLLGAISATSADDTIAASLVRLTADVDGKTRSGSGFIVAIDDDVAYILTAKHVIAGTQYPDVDFTIDPARTHRGEVMQNDPHEDLTVLRVMDPPDGVQPLVIARDSAVVRDTVLLVGFPSRASNPHYRAAAVSATDGTRLILDRKVLPGDSGGPVLKHDEVVGLVVSKRQGREDFAKAIPRSTVALALESWLEGVDLPKPRGTAERRLSFILTNIENIPLPDLQLARGEHVSEPTSSTGYSTIQAMADDEAGSAITDLTVPAPLASKWMLLSNRVHVPRKDEPYIHLIAIKRSDFRQIASGALKALSFHSASAGANIDLAEKKAIIAGFARERGLTESQLEQAIKTFGKTTELLDKGVAELLKGAYLAAEELFKASLDSAKLKIDRGEAQAKAGRNEAADSAYHLGRSLQAVEKYRAAVSAFREALQYRPNDLSTMSELGLTLILDKKPNEAHVVLQEAIALHSRAPDPESASELDQAMNLAGMALLHLGDQVGSKEHHQYAFEFYRRSVGPEDERTLQWQSNLASSLAGLGSHRKSLELRKKVLEIRSTILGEEHPETLASLVAVGASMRELGDVAGSLRLQERAFQGSKRALASSEHPRTLQATAGVASALVTSENYAQAQELQEQIITIAERTLGTEDAITLRVKRDLTRTLWLTGDAETSRPILEQLVEIQRRLYSDRDYKSYSAMNNLAGVRLSLGDYVGALSLYEETLSVVMPLLGGRHPMVFTLMGQIAYTRWNLGYSGAKDLLQSTLRRMEVTLGDKHPDYIFSCHLPLEIAILELDFETIFKIESKYSWLLESDPDILSSEMKVARKRLLDSLNNSQ